MIERYALPEMSAIWSEQNKLDKWLAVEIGVSEGWAELGVIPREAAERIRHARYDEQRIAAYFERTHHDMTAFTRSLSESLGEERRFVHLGLTSSDVIDTGLSLQLLEAADLLLRDLQSLEAVLTRRAVEHRRTLMTGRTHGVHAEPMTFGLKLALWVDEVRRARRRLEEARAVVAVGKISGAVGTHASVPPALEDFVCGQLGLAVAPVSNQIIQRDRHAQYVTTLALIGASLEKFATEIRSLQRTEILEVEEPFSPGQTGSSAMPHKRNPEKCERVAGLARVLRGYAVTAMEDVALWNERDISHSSAERILFPDACGLLHYMLVLFTSIMDGLLIYPERMIENLDLTHGLLFSQRVLLSLIERGLAREEAYTLVQRNAMCAWRERSSFLELLGGDRDVNAHLSAQEIERLFDYGYYLQH
ncbi:MAG: adenylosuccinate lyase, partial [Dehalococcoidia bacterium]